MEQINRLYEAIIGGCNLNNIRYTDDTVDGRLRNESKKNTETMQCSNGKE